MNKTRRLWLHIFVLGLAFIALIGYGAAVISIFVTAHANKITSLEFCITSTCIGNFLNYFTSALAVAKATSDFLVAIATVGGIGVALLTYISSTNNAALTNHIAHYNVFQGFVENEIRKRDRVNSMSVDIFFWYNLIYPRSRSGSIEVSTAYRLLVSKLNGCITASNDRAKHAKNGSFRYLPHQRDMIDALRDFGIAVQLQPRNSFYEIEDQVLSLIAAVNQSFCHSEAIATLDKRRYV